MVDRDLGFDLSGRTLGEFVLREVIGGGGSSTVYRSFQPRLRREVVVKVVHPELQDRDESLPRFIREARLASQLDHPYAAHVYTFGVEDQGRLLWIAMELVRGITLRRWLMTHGPMPLEKLVPLVDRLAEAIQAAHDRGIVHRDIKPSNVMVTEDKGEMIPKLLDFGIAKLYQKAARPMRDIGESEPDGIATDAVPPQADTPGNGLPATALATSSLLAMPEPHTPWGVRIGSHAYMAPEQWKNAAAVGPAADIYSLGIVIYEALTGDPPFVADTADDYYRRHMYDPVRETFRPGLDPVLQRALAKEAHDRYRTVLELAADLRAALRASQLEQVRATAQRWNDQGRPRGLLWGHAELANVEDEVVPEVLSELDRSFLAASQRHARRFRWSWGALVLSAAAVVVTALAYRSVLQARMTAQRAADQMQLAQEQARAAQRVTDATTTQAELEQGRAALLHGEPEAQLHLGRAYQRGDHSPSTMFMYARALQPKLAELARFPSLSGRMWSAAFSPDSRQIVTTDDQGAQVWDAQTYRLLFKLPHGSEVYQAVYSTDGARLVTAAKDAIRIWDATRGTLVHTLSRMLDDDAPPDYFLMALSSDGRLVSAIDAAGAVAHVWDTTTGAPLAKLRADAMEFPGLAFSADGHWLAATGGNDVRVFDTRTWRLTLTIRGPHIHSLAFDPTGPRLLTGAATGDAAIWEIPSGGRIHSLRGKGDPVDAVAFSPDGQLALTASRDGTEQVWRARSGELQSHFNPRRSKIHAVEFDPTSKLAVAAGTDGTVVVADAMQGTVVTELEGPKNIVWASHFDPSSRRIVGASWDGTARVWDATPPYRRWSSPPISDDCGIITSPEPDTRFIAVGCRDHATRVWDTSRDQLLAELPSVPHIEGDFTSAFPAVSQTGDRAAITRGQMVEVYELPGGRLLRTIAHDALVNAVAFARAERGIVSGAINGALLVTHDDGTQLTLPGSSGGIDAVAWLPDGRLVTADAQRRLRVYDRGGSVLANLEIPMRVMSLRAEGARLVTVPLYSGSAAPALVLDLEHYRVVARLEGHVGAVYSARWVAGNQILTAGGDGTAKLWDGATGRLRQTYQGGSRFLVDATLTPDGIVMAGGADGLLRFWDETSGRLLWMFQAHTSQVIGVHVEGDNIVTRGFSGELSRWALPDSKQVIGACADKDRCTGLRGNSTK